MHEVALLTSLAACTTHRNPPEAGAAGSAENVDAQARDARAHAEVRAVEDLLPSVARAGGPAPWGKKNSMEHGARRFEYNRPEKRHVRDDPGNGLETSAF